MKFQMTIPAITMLLATACTSLNALAGIPASTPFPASDASYGCYRIPATITLPNGEILG